ncbi:MAG: response regulator [Sedimentisphaerales bacterium]
MGKRILVVDDEPDLLKVILLRLKKNTMYEVYGCTQGQEVLDIVRQVVPDLIILDVYLPIINGDDFARILKKDAKLKHIPVILISAATSSLDERAKKCGADGYLSKPFEPEELINIIEKTLGQDDVAKVDIDEIKITV